MQLIEYQASGAITNDADKGIWDVTFMPVDAERAKRVSFGAAYHVLTSTYLVMPNAPVNAIADADRPDVRIAIVDGTATSRAARAASKKATFIVIRGVDEGVALLKDGKADAIALSRESLTGLVGKLPGSRILDGGFLNSLHRRRRAERQAGGARLCLGLCGGAEGIGRGAQELRRDRAEEFRGGAGGREAVAIASAACGLSCLSP